MEILDKNERKLEEILKDKNITHFKIGKTSEQNIHERLNQADYKDKYDDIMLIKEGTPEEIAFEEDKLINYAKERAVCDNENTGSGGAEGDKLYVVVKYKK